jgi:hypothetical protein
MLRERITRVFVAAILDEKVDKEKMAERVLNELTEEHPPVNNA